MAATVLLVHDDPSLRKLLRLRFEVEGIAVREILDIRRAVEDYRNIADEIAVVVAGVRMAGLNGAELLIALRKVNPLVKVFFFSSHQPLLSDPAPPGVQVFPKPHGLSDLLRAVRELLPEDATASASPSP